MARSRPLWTLACALAVGCGRSEAPAAPPSAGARPEAGLTIYAAQGGEVTDPVVDAYRERNPALRIEIIRGGMGEMLSRIRAERGKPIGDLLWGGSPEMYAINDELFAKAEVSEADRFVMTDPSGKWHAYSTNVIYLVVNTTRVSHVPASYRELLAPEFRRQGPIAFSNPVVSGTAYTILTALVSVRGWEFVDSMLGNVWLTDSSDSMFKWVKDGETAAGFLFEASLRDYLASGAPLRPVLAEEGLITQSDGAGLIAGGPHPENARAFLNFMASREAHEIVRAKVGRRSARVDVAPAQGLLDLTGRKLIRADPLWVGRDRPRILARFDEAREKR
jgi:iron(III) transport system substrate-binding protein